MIGPLRIVGAEFTSGSVPRYSSGVSLDFMADLVAGQLREPADYPLRPVGFIGVQLGRPARLVVLADGRKVPVSRPRFDAVRLAVANRAVLR